MGNEIAHKLKDSFEDISPFIQRHTSVVCPSCPKVCCIDRHGSYENEDLVFLTALGAKLPLHQPKSEDTEPCRFLEATGCLLPRWLRPFRCTWYFCPSLLEEISKDRPRDYRRFVSSLQALLRLRQGLIMDGKTLR